MIVWDETSGTGIVDGLAFDSGFEVWPAKDLVTERTLDYRVPMILTAALTAHVGFRLQETRVARGNSRTSNLLLLLPYGRLDWHYYSPSGLLLRHTLIPSSNAANICVKNMSLPRYKV